MCSEDVYRRLAATNKQQREKQKGKIQLTAPTGRHLHILYALLLNPSSGTDIYRRGTSGLIAALAEIYESVILYK